MPFTQTEVRTFVLDKGHAGKLTFVTVPGSTDIRMEISLPGEESSQMELSREELTELRNTVLLLLWRMPPLPSVLPAAEDAPPDGD